MKIDKQDLINIIEDFCDLRGYGYENDIYIGYVYSNDSGLNHVKYEELADYIIGRLNEQI